MNEHLNPATESSRTPSPGTVPRQSPPEPPEEKHSRAWVWILILVIVGAAAYYYVTHQAKQQPGAGETAGESGRGGGRRGRGAGIPPIVAVKAVRGDIGVFVTGLGAVTPIFTVSVKSRVDGQLMQVLYKEGQRVKDGDPLVEIDPRPYQATLTQYEGNLLRDQAALQNAKVDLARYQQLITKKAVPQQTLATQEALVAQDEGTVKADQGLIDSVKLNIAYCHITAPISGRVGLRLIDPGNYVSAAASTPLAVITQEDPISVIFTLPEDQLGEVSRRFNAGARLSVDAYDREMNRKIASGTLGTIDNQIDQTTGTVKLRAAFNNRGGKLFPNQFVNAKMLVEERHQVVLLENAAVQRNSNFTYAFLVKPDSTVTIRHLTLGATDGENTEIMSGLEPGDVVVMTGVDKLQEGSKVQVHMEGEQTRSQRSGNSTKTEGAAQ